MTTNPVLSVPNFHSTMILRTNASITYLGGCLYQFNNNGNQKILGYWSRAVNKSEEIDNQIKKFNKNDIFPYHKND